MKKAVIAMGKKQYIVSENQELDVIHMPNSSTKSLELEPLLVIDDDKILVGNPAISGSKVSINIVEPTKKGEKTQSIRYKAKKRVHKIRGNRQLLSTIKVSKIS